MGAFIGQAFGEGIRMLCTGGVSSFQDSFPAFALYQPSDTLYFLIFILFIYLFGCTGS